MDFIKRFFNRADAAQVVPEKVIAKPKPHSGRGLDVFSSDVDPGEYAITRYPPFDKGIPVISPDKILRSQQEMIEHARRSSGASKEDFKKNYLQPIVNLASYVHLLPATSTTYFRGTGGLFRMSLEIALNGLESANTGVFPIASVERRNSLLPKWTLATFLAGLCSQCFRTFNTLSVLTRDNEQWQPLLGMLYDWCVDCEADVYFVRWMEEMHIRGEQATASYAISSVIPKDVLQFLSEDNNQILQAMTAAIAGVDPNTSENPIARLIAPVITRVIEGDRQRTAENYGHLVIGAHLEPHLLDAMRRLVKNGTWIANNPMSGGRVWCGQDGVYVDWLPAAQDISAIMAKDSFVGIPKDADTLADLLLRAGLLQSTRSGEKYWTLILPETMENKEGFVRLKDGTLIFPRGYDITQFDNITLCVDSGQNRRQRRMNPTPPPAQQAQQAKPQPAANIHQSPPMPSSFSNDPPVPEKLPDYMRRDADEDQEEAIEAAQPPKQDKPFWANGQDRNSPQSNPDTEITDAEENALDNRDEDEETEERDIESNGDKVEQAGTKQLKKAEKQVATPVAAKAAPPEKKANGGNGGNASMKPAGSAEKKTDGGNTPEALLAALKKSNAWLLEEILTAKKNDQLKGLIVPTPNGTGISMEELTRHGVPPMELMNELSMKGWLYVDRTKPTKIVHKIDHNGAELSVVILKPEFANILGLGGN
jgi:conjugal transfer pilus assembly protein TraI